MHRSASVVNADTACVLQPWAYSIGFVLTFSALFAKINRVKKVFLNQNLRRVVVKASEMIMYVAVIVLIDAAILIQDLSVWQHGDTVGAE